MAMTHFVPRIVQHISAIWLSYGKCKKQLDILKGMHGFDPKNPQLEENYDAFYRHTRIQFYLDSSVFRCWLLLATHNNLYDRSDFIDRQLKDSAGKDAFFKLVRPLFDKGFFYELTDVSVEPSKPRRLQLVSEVSQQKLIKFVKEDREGFYSGIAKEYRPDDPALDVTRIGDEMITNLKLLWPLYDFMAWRPGKR